MLIVVQYSIMGLCHNLFTFFFYWIFLVVLGFEFEASCLLGRHSTAWVTPPALFYVEYFQDRVSQTICLGWLQTMFLLISSSLIARITGLSHWCPALIKYFKNLLYILYITKNIAMSTLAHTSLGICKGKLLNILLNY
jgi:hypothetical protein